MRETSFDRHTLLKAVTAGLALTPALAGTASATSRADIGVSVFPFPLRLDQPERAAHAADRHPGPGQRQPAGHVVRSGGDRQHPRRPGSRPRRSGRVGRRPGGLRGQRHGGWNTIGSATTTLTMAAGTNTIRLGNPTGWAPDIDRLVIA